MATRSQTGYYTTKQYSTSATNSAFKGANDPYNDRKNKGGPPISTFLCTQQGKPDVYGLKKKPDSRVQGKQLKSGVAHGKQFTKTSYTGLFQPCTTHKFPGKNPYQTNIRECSPRALLSCASTPTFPSAPNPLLSHKFPWGAPVRSSVLAYDFGGSGARVASHCPPTIHPRQPCVPMPVITSHLTFFVASDTSHTPQRTRKASLQRGARSVLGPVTPRNGTSSCPISVRPPLPRTPLLPGKLHTSHSRPFATSPPRRPVIPRHARVPCCVNHARVMLGPKHCRQLTASLTSCTLSHPPSPNHPCPPPPTIRDGAVPRNLEG